MRDQSISGLFRALQLSGQYFFGQSYPLLNKLRRTNRSVSNLLLTWSLLCKVLSLSFTSILLRTFFIKTPQLTVNTLEELMADPNIQIAGRQGLRDIEQYNFTIYEALRYRVAEYEDILGINSELSPRNMSIESRLMTDIVNRKAVILAETATKVYVDQSSCRYEFDGIRKQV